MKLLLTGFEPFEGSDVNSSEEVVRAMGRRRVDGVTLETAILPVVGVKGPEALIEAVKRFRPNAVLSLGEAEKRNAVSIERVFINLRDYKIPDNAGRRIVDEPIIADGPTAYFATLPVREMCRVMQAAGIPAELSQSAGTFLCNEVAYSLLHHFAVGGRYVPTGFVHLPRLAGGGETSARSGMSTATLCTAITAAVEAIGYETATLPSG